MTSAQVDTRPKPSPFCGEHAGLHLGPFDAAPYLKATPAGARPRCVFCDGTKTHALTCPALVLQEWHTVAPDPVEV